MIDYDIKRRLQRIASSFNAKARRYHVPGVISWEMLARAGWTCHYCGIQLTLDHGTWDHVQAFDRGGNNWITNVVRSCTLCQRTKHTKSEAEFLEHRQMLVACLVCEKQYKPRWAEWQRGYARTCSHECAGKLRGTGGARGEVR